MYLIDIKNRRLKLSKIPGTSEWVRKKQKPITKKAQDIYDFDSDKKIPAIEQAFSNELEKKIAYMLANSHEYNKPNTKSAISFVKNYKWENDKEKIENMQGIDKPIKEDKVESMMKDMKGKKIPPFICVNKFQGIRPQTVRKKILIDGHHRKEVYKRLGVNEVPIYKGTYSGKAEKSIEELLTSK